MKLPPLPPEVTPHPLRESILQEGMMPPYGGDDGGGPGMEARIKRLEDDMTEVKSDLKAMRSDLSYIRGKLDSMPTTLQLIGFAVAIFVAAGITNLFK